MQNTPSPMQMINPTIRCNLDCKQTKKTKIKFIFKCKYVYFSLLPIWDSNSPVYLSASCWSPPVRYCHRTDSWPLAPLGWASSCRSWTMMMSWRISFGRSGATSTDPSHPLGWPWPYVRKIKFYVAKCEFIAIVFLYIPN